MKALSTGTGKIYILIKKQQATANNYIPKIFKGENLLTDPYAEDDEGSFREVFQIPLS